MENELLQAKLRLYSLLLKKGTGNMTERELNLAFELSQDEQVQSYVAPDKEQKTS